MPAQRDIDLMRQRSIGCLGRLSWVGDLDSLASAIAAAGALEAEVSEDISESIHDTAPPSLDIWLPSARAHGTLYVEADPLGWLNLSVSGPDHIVWRLLDLFALRLHQLEIPHEITVWDRMASDHSLNISAYHANPG